MTGFIRGWVRRQDMTPSAMGFLVNPFFAARRGLLKHMIDLGPRVRGRTLDVGCGSKPYEKLFKAASYVGLDVDSAKNRSSGRADVFYNGKQFPFQDKEFDSLVATQVLEHVFNPEEFLKEARRVLADGGVLLLTVPFVWDEHEQPYDFARYSSFGLRHILEKEGFDILDMRKSVNDVRVLFQLANAYIYKKTATRHGWLNRLAALALMAPVSLLGELAALIFPKNEDLYLDNVVLARKRAG